MFNYNAILGLFAIGFFAWYWWSAQQVKERALHATASYCREKGVQLLDGSVALNALWFKRDAIGNFRIWRTYAFDFASTGEERYRGRVVLLGNTIEDIQLEPHQI